MSRPAATRLFSPADAALSQVRQALKEECQNHPTLFMMETKKLYLRIERDASPDN